MMCATVFQSNLDCDNNPIVVEVKPDVQQEKGDDIVKPSISSLSVPSLPGRYLTRICKLRIQISKIFCDFVCFKCIYNAPCWEVNIEIFYPPQMLQLAKVHSV